MSSGTTVCATIMTRGGRALEMHMPREGGVVAIVDEARDRVYISCSASVPRLQAFVRDPLRSPLAITGLQSVSAGDVTICNVEFGADLSALFTRTTINEFIATTEVAVFEPLDID